MKTNLVNSVTNWSLKVKLLRLLWTFFIEPLFRWLPRFCSPLRVAVLRMMGASIGKTCLILPGVKVLMPWNLILEDYVAIGRNVNFYNFSPINVGSMTVISQNVFLCTGTHDYEQSNMPLIFHPITIGRECWVAAEAFISPNTNIADGIVVGARSVVTKSLSDEWSVYAGNPCKKIKARKMKEVFQ